MGNGLDTLIYSTSEIDKLLLEKDENLEWLNSEKFNPTRQLLNIITKIIREKKEDQYTREYLELKKIFFNSLKENINSKNEDCKNKIEKTLENNLVSLDLNKEDKSLNKGLTWVNNNGKPYIIE